MRMAWKVHRLTKKELCHSNETWHALNSTFPDTNCIVSFQINPHWISNSGLWKVVLETFWKTAWKNWWRESCFTRTMLLHTSLQLHWLLWVTVALNWLITLHILLIVAPFDYLLFPNIKKLLAGKQYRTNDEVISAVEDFFKDQDESFYAIGIQALQRRWKKCVDRRGDYVEKYTTFGQIWPLHHCQPINFSAYHRTLNVHLLIGYTTWMGTKCSYRLLQLSGEYCIESTNLGLYKGTKYHVIFAV